MNPFRIAAFFAVVCAFMDTCALAQDATEDAYAARDVCVGFAANYINAPPGTSFTYNAGRFRIVGTVGQRATIFEGSTQVASIPNFNYKDYTTCVDNTLKSMAAGRKKTEIKRSLALFNASAELSSTLHVGDCMQTMAMRGFYFGDLSQSNIANGENVVNEENFYQTFAAIDRALSKNVSEIYQREIHFSLANDVNFFRFVPGKSVPYFAMESVQRNSEKLTDVADADDLAFIQLGSEVGKFTRLYGYYGGFLQGSYQTHPADSGRIAAINQTLACLDTPVRSAIASIQSLILELKFPYEVNVPTIEEIRMMTADQIRTNDKPTAFISAIRSNIRSL
jgi:hypothetical protein